MKQESTKVKMTKKLIQETYINLLTTDGEEKINITKLCETAEINRGTFYKYYQDLDQLLNDIYTNLFVELKSIMEAKSLIFNTEELFMYVLNLIEKNKVLFKKLISYQFDSNLFNIFLSSSKEKFIEELKNYTDNLELINDIYYYNLTGTLKLISNWVDNNFDKTKKHLAQEITLFNTILITSVLFPKKKQESN